MNFFKFCQFLRFLRIQKQIFVYSRVLKKAQKVAGVRIIIVNKLHEIRGELNEYELDIYGNTSENREEYMRNVIDGSRNFLFQQKDIKGASTLRVV